MKNIITTAFLCIFGLFLTFGQQKQKPNILLIVADDLGYSDLGCYGGEVNTPSLDKMSGEGVRLSNMHNASMCVTTRSAMLTGKWWPKAGSGIKDGPNVAEELKKEGYRTGLVGKWHLDGEPNDKGFDYFFGFLNGFASYYLGNGEYRLNKTPFTNFGKDFYSTDEFTDRAIEFVSDQGDNKPFFLFLSYQAPHNPLQAPREDIMKYRGKYLKGWEAIRNARIKNQIKFGMIKPGTPLPELPQNLPDWETLTPEQKDMEDLRMAVYAAMVERMDGGIGRLMAALEKNDQKDNTFILFMSDNGTDSFSTLDVPMLARKLLPGDPESNYQVGTGWGYATVAPWRLYKISQHGGGVKTGAIAVWPKGVKEPGSIRSEAVNIVDIMPTFMELATTKTRGENSENEKLVGKSFLPLLQDKKWKRPGPMYFQYMDNRAIRTEKWSLLEVDGYGWELYDAQKDPLETKDLAKEYPNVVAKLSKDWLKWWTTESKTETYVPTSTASGPHYKPQGDKGSGKIYVPSAMPEELSHKYKKE